MIEFNKCGKDFFRSPGDSWKELCARMWQHRPIFKPAQEGLIILYYDNPDNALEML